MSITTLNKYVGDGTPLEDRSTYFGFTKSGNYVAAAHGNPSFDGAAVGGVGGAVIYDVSNPNSVAKLFEHKMVLDTEVENNNPTCRATIIYGTPYTVGARLVCIWRRGDESDSPGGNSGSMVFTFDISDVDENNWGIDSGNWASDHYFVNTQIDNNNGALSNRIPMYSDASLSGTTLTIFSQVSGTYQFDVTNIGAGPINTNNDQSSHEYETQGGCVLTNGPSSGMVAVANYRFGVRLLSSSLVDLAADAGIVATPTDEEDGTKKLRTWDLTPDDTGQFLFGSYSSTGAASGTTSNSGLIIYDVRDPAAPTLLDNYALPVGDRDNWHGTRDPACLRISQIDGFVFVSNMGKGYAIWDCRDALSPVYLGAHPDSLQTAAGSSTSDTVSGNIAWRDGGEYFVAYGDGYQPAGNGSKQFYVDQIEGLKMSFDYIGNYKPTGTASGQTVGAASATTRSMETTEANGPRIYGPVLGTETLDIVGAFAGDGDVAEELIFGVYEAASETDGTPTGNPLFGPDNVPVIDAPLASRELVVSHSLAAHVGKYLSMGVTANATISIERDSVLQSNSRSDPGGSLPSPWVETQTNGHDLEVWYRVNIPDIVGSPTLTTPYNIGTNSGPLFSVTTSDTLATIEGAGFFNDNAAYASLLKTDDVLLINASNGTKMYTVTVDKEQRIITLSTGLTIT